MTRQCYTASQNLAAFGCEGDKCAGSDLMPSLTESDFECWPQALTKKATPSPPPPIPIVINPSLLVPALPASQSSMAPTAAAPSTGSGSNSTQTAVDVRPLLPLGRRLMRLE
jgi:hypothetical protein